MMKLKNSWYKKCRKVKDSIDTKVIENEEVIDQTIDIKRPIYTESKFNSIYEKNKFEEFQVTKEIKTEFKKHFCHGKNSVKKMIYNRFPIVKWVKDYRIGEFLLSDFLAGIIIGIMQIPQGTIMINILCFCEIMIKFKD